MTNIDLVISVALQAFVVNKLTTSFIAQIYIYIINKFI